MKGIRRTGSKDRVNLDYDERLVADELFAMSSSIRKTYKSYEIICFTKKQAKELERLIPIKMKKWTAKWQYDLIDKVYRVRCKKG